MNKTINDILNRTSTKDFSDKEVELELLDKVLECGTYAPSAKGNQSGIIIAIKNKELKNELVKICMDIRKIDYDPFYNANVIILVAALKDSVEPVKDGSCILENMFIAAESLGLGACWINCVKSLPTTIEGVSFMKKINVGEEYMIIGSCALGYPNKKTPKKEHKADYIRKFL